VVSPSHSGSNAEFVADPALPLGLEPAAAVPPLLDAWPPVAAGPPLSAESPPLGCDVEPEELPPWLELAPAVGAVLAVPAVDEGVDGSLELEQPSTTK
jgi:hypothetical protein